ncbi:MAG: hypothetical protein NTX01_00445 [Candidatus Omnitrophica bacterium]|nr:hypothetical protein [Candidatus Omnitrophota bacterium]
MQNPPDGSPLRIAEIMRQMRGQGGEELEEIVSSPAGTHNDTLPCEWVTAEDIRLRTKGRMLDGHLSLATAGDAGVFGGGGEESCQLSVVREKEAEYKFNLTDEEWDAVKETVQKLGCRPTKREKEEARNMISASVNSKAALSPTAKEAYFYLREKSKKDLRELAEVEMIESLDIGSNDYILFIGAGVGYLHPLLCAVEGARRVNICQPPVIYIGEKRYSQTEKLKEILIYSGNMLENFFGIDIVASRIDMDSYQNYAEYAGLPGRMHRYCFLSNVIENIFSLKLKRTLIKAILDSLQDEAYILISVFVASVDEEIAIIQEEGKKLGYSVVRGRKFIGFNGTYELIVRRGAGGDEADEGRR